MISTRNLLILSTAATAFVCCVQHDDYQQLELSLSGTCDLPFGFIGGIRELSNRNVIVSDPLGVALVMVDFESGIVDTIGSIGAGPDEYRQPDRVLPLPGDSTLLVDLGNARLTILDAEGAFTTHLPIAQLAESGASAMVVPRFSDGVGRLYFSSEGSGGSRTGGLAAVVRFDRGAGVFDTITTIEVPDRTRLPPPIGGQPAIPPDLFLARDDWAVAVDGSVATVDSRDYVVTWISAPGSARSGPAISYEPVKLQAEQRELLLSELLPAQISMRSGAETSGIAMIRGLATGQRLSIDHIEWPDALPAFRPERAIISAENQLWVERYTAPGHAPVIDMFDRAGVKQVEVHLPKARRVVGFGIGVVYLAKVDQVGLEWLEMYRWTGETDK